LGSVVKSCLAWPEAVRSVARWLADQERIDSVLEALPSGMDRVERARCQHLVYGVVRHAGRLEELLNLLIAHPPRFTTRAALLLAGFELIDAADPGAQARIVHHAVEQTKALASPAEARLVNAVGRRLAAALAAQKPLPRFASAEELGERYSHPVWLVRRWLIAFGAEPTRRLLEWNQTPAPVHLRWRQPAAAPPPWAQATAWPGFFSALPGHWPEIEAEISAGRAYVQDPGTRLAVELLDPRPGETILDACAAPGGKALQIADAMRTGRLVALDASGAEAGDPRFRRLTDNLRSSPLPVAAVGLDLLHPRLGAELERRGAPARYDAVLLDAPCSNTGVMRHRIDVKWRLRETDFGRHARQQLQLLAAAAALVAPGGRLVYSTCSIDPEENEQVAGRFLERHPGFQGGRQALARPWTEGHDGAGVFVFRSGH
jgi:16S rRNA (cytosine967-C5)-methyltransferase